MQRRILLQHSFIIVLVAIIGFSQVAFMQHMLKYDNMSYFYPMRHFIGECIHNHILPLWNPYLYAGTPSFGDPQNGSWYPFVWFVGILGGYNPVVFALEFITHIILAGFGMYFLVFRFTSNYRASLLIGLSYMLSGFFVGNAQHLTWIIAGTWIPYILGFYYESISRKNFSVYSIMATAFFIYLLISGGHPSFVFVTFYILVFISLSSIYIRLKDKDFKYAVKIIGKNGLMCLFSILFCAVILVSQYYTIPQMTRSGGLTLEQALLLPFSPQSSISFLYPFATVKKLDFFATDFSMNNIYFGLLPLLLGVFVWKYRKVKCVILYTLLGFFFLTVAFGSYLPLRKWLYLYVPLMDLFRYPAMFRLFSIISFLLLAGKLYSLLEADIYRLRKYVTIVSIALGILNLFIILTVNAPFTLSFLKSNLLLFSEQTYFSLHLRIQAYSQLMALALLLILLWSKWFPVNGFRIFLLFTVIDLSIASNLNAPYTVYDHSTSVCKALEFEKKLPKGFPIPNYKLNNQPNIDFAGTGYWGNKDLTAKRISLSAFTPFSIKNLSVAVNNFESLLDSSLCNTLVFYPDSIFPGELLADSTVHKSFSPTSAYILGVKKAGKNILGAGDSITLKAFSPGFIEAKISADTAKWIVLIQSQFEGWKAFYNTKPLDIKLVNGVFMGVKIPEGRGILRFKFVPKYIIPSFLLTIFTLLFFLLFSFYRLYSNRNEPISK